MRTVWRPLLAPLVAAALLIGAAEPALRPIPHPDLERLGQVGEHLAEEVARLEAVQARPGRGPGELGEAYGELGRLYLAYELLEPAEAALANAAALAAGDPRWSYTLAYLHRRAGRLERAAELFRRTLELRPGYRPAMLRLAQLYLDLGRGEEAEALLAPIAGERDSAVEVLLGKAALARGDPRAALDRFAAVLAAEPEAGWVHYQIARAYRGLGRLEEARRHLELQTAGSFAIDDPLIHELPTLVGGAARHRRRAAAAWAAGRVERAVAEYRSAVASDPERDDLRIGLAVVLAESGDLDGAVEQYRTVVERSPDDLLARYGLARALAGRGDDREALAHYDASLARQPDFTDALEGRAMALEALGRVEEALAEHARLVALEPWNLASRRARAAALVRAERPADAAAELEVVLAADPADAAAALDLGSLYARLGRPGAEARLRSVLALAADPATHAAARFNLGLLYAERGLPDRAAEELAAAARLQPDWGAAHARLGEALEAAGRPAEAAAAWGRAVALAPEDGWARLRHGVCLMAAGRFAEAAAELEEGFARFPGSGELAHQLARLLAASPEAGLRDGARAVELATAVARAGPSLDHLETLAMALAESGRFAEAVSAQERALGLAVAGGEPEARLAGMRATLAGYREGRPFRLSPAGSP